MVETLLLERLKTLTVTNLKKELDKRGLEKSGLKADLLIRLERSIVEGGNLSSDGNRKMGNSKISCDEQT